MMRWSLLLLFLAALPAERTDHFRYLREVTAREGAQACAVLDPAIYAHAGASLRDLRLRSRPSGAEVPYVLTLSGTGEAESEPARVVNLRAHGQAIAFDLQMPRRNYTDVELAIDAKDFVAAATVTGTAAGEPLQLGSFTLFDLSAQGLSRMTVLHLQELHLPVLHVVLTPLAGGTVLRPEMLHDATVPPSRAGQTRYSAIMSTAKLEQHGRATEAHFMVAPRIPIERVRLRLKPGFAGNFSREVMVASHAAGQAERSGEVVTGRIERVHLSRGGASLVEEQLAVPATLGANLQTAAEVEVSIRNGDDAPLPVQSVTLETRQRELCFEAPKSGGALALFYGDAKLEAARYDYARTFQATRQAAAAALGPEQNNPNFAPRKDMRSISERHPRLGYLGLILVVSLLAVVALRSGRLRL